MLKSFVTKNQPVVNIPDVRDEQAVIGQRLLEVDGQNLLAEGHNHKAQGRRWAAHRASTRR